MLFQLRALCHDDVEPDLAFLARLSQVVLSNGEEPPEWIMLVPAGDKIEALDGRTFSNSSPQAVVDAFDADPRDIPLDWEHATERIDDPDGPDTAPAAAWIDALEVRDGVIWGHIKEWTPRGTESVTTKEYRYISPAFLFKKAGRVVAKIISAALVNRPALDMPALARSARHNKGIARENTMDRDKLIQLLGLAADASDEDIEAAIQAREQEAQSAVEAKVEAERVATEAKAAKTQAEGELANARAANPSLDRFVPRADYDAAIARNKELEADVAQRAQDVHAQEVNAAITSALKDGKITPATKDYHQAVCMTKEGLAQFRSFVDQAPTVCAPSDLEGRDPPDAGEKKMTDSQRAIARQCGVSDEDFEKARAD